MPLYDFEDTKTGERFTEIMTIGNRETYLENNPHIKQVHLKAPSLVSGTDFNKKQDNGWKENLSRIAEAHPNSALAEKQGGRSSKDAKVNDLAKKHNLRKKGQYSMDL